MNKESTSGDNGATSGAADSGKTDTSGSGTYPAEFVSKLKTEKENLAKALAAMRDELASVKTEKQTREQQELEQKQEYKRLYEAEKQRLEGLNKEYTGLKDQINQGKLNSALRSELVKLGLDEQHLEAALRLVDRNIVNIDPGTQVVVGADEAAKQFYSQYSSLGFFKKQTTVANHTATKTINSGPLDLSKMSQEDKIKALAKLRRG